MSWGSSASSVEVGVAHEQVVIDLSLKSLGFLLQWVRNDFC